MTLDDNLQREEARGLFVLGVIAALLAAKDVLGIDIRLNYGLVINTGALYPLIFFWGAYAFLMALAVSDDMFSSRIRRDLRSLAGVVFLLGIFFSLLFVMLSLLGPPMVSRLGQETGSWAALVTCLAATLSIVVVIFRLK
jgi:hypothetical protein